MKTLLLLAFMASASTPDYVHPVRVQILQGVHNQAGKGTGHGNVYDPTFGTKGFDYAYSGCWDFGLSIGSERYAARWQADQELLMVVHAIGSDKTQECTLHVTLRDVVYVAGKDGQLTTKPVTPARPH